MIHLYKITLTEHSDMFVRELDLKSNFITYQVLDPQGKALEPIKKDKFITHQGNIVFDKNRTLPLNLVQRINETLNQ